MAAAPSDATASAASLVPLALPSPIEASIDRSNASARSDDLQVRAAAAATRAGALSAAPRRQVATTAAAKALDLAAGTTSSPPL